VEALTVQYLGSGLEDPVVAVRPSSRAQVDARLGARISQQDGRSASCRSKLLLWS
jgi:hypothetical protein